MSARSLVWISSLAAAALAAQWLAALAWSPLNPDAGFYLPVARDMLRGAALYDEIPCRYPPLAIYCFQLLGERGLANPIAAMTFVDVLHGLNFGLLFLLLRRLDFDVPLAAFGTLLGAVWIYASEGASIVIEPFGTLALLAALLAATWNRPPLAAAVIGVALACAVLTKPQHGVYLPPLFLLAAVGLGPRPAPRSPWQSLAIAAAAFAATLFVAPVVLGLPWSETLARAIGWGVADDYPTTGIKGLVLALTTGPGPGRVVLVWLAVAALLTWRATTPTHSAMLTGLALSILPLAIRDYGHYAQLSAVWVVLVTLFAAREFAAAARDRAAFERLLALLIALPLIPVWLATVPVSYRHATTRPRVQQQAAAREVVQTAESDDLTLVLDAPWLYPLADLTAPAHDYRFVARLDRASARRDAADRVLWAPVKEAADRDRVQAWIVAGGFHHTHTTKTDPAIRCYRRQP